MLRRPPVLTRPATPFPYTPLFRSKSVAQLDFAAQVGAPLLHPDRDRAFAMIVTAFLFLAAMIMRGVRTRGDAIIGIEIADRRSEEHTSELQSLMRISYAVFCLKKKIKKTHNIYIYITHTINY